MHNLSGTPLGFRLMVILAAIGALAVSFPNIVCFFPEYTRLCTSECRAIHIGYFMLRLIIFTSVILLCLAHKPDSSLIQITKRNLVICAIGYIVLLPLSISASRYICSDARGSILIFQFLFAAILSTFISMYFQNQTSAKSHPVDIAKSDEKVKRILVSDADKILPIPVDDIAYIYTTNRQTIITTNDGQSYGYTHSLDSIMSTLDNSAFYRANKRFIVSRKAISELTVWFDSRLLVHLNDLQPPEPIYVSKNKAAQFKKWVAGHQ